MRTFTACVQADGPVMVKTSEGYYGKVIPDENGMFVLPISEEDIVWKIYDRTGLISEIQGFKPSDLRAAPRINRWAGVLRRRLAHRSRVRARSAS